MNTDTFNLLKFKTIYFGKSSQKSLHKVNFSGILMVPKEKNYSSYLQQLTEADKDSKRQSKKHLNCHNKKPFSSKFNNHFHRTKSKFIKKEEGNENSTNNLKEIEETIKQKLIKMNKKIELEQSACEVMNNHYIDEKEISLSLSNHTSPLMSIDRIHYNYSKTLMFVQKKNLDPNRSDNSNNNILNNSDHTAQNKTALKMTLDNIQQSNLFVKLNDENNKEKYRRLEIKKGIFDSLDEEEELCENINYFYISADGNFTFIFGFLVIIFTIYSFIFYPIYIAKSNCFCLKEKYYSKIIKYLNEIIFICDLIISFFREYYNYDLELVNDNQFIIIHYLQTGFILDLFEAIPFYYLSQTICDNSKSMCTEYSMTTGYIILKLLNLLKILKIGKILRKDENKVIKDFYILISEYYSIEKFVDMAIFIIECLVFLHVLICLHIFFGRIRFPNWIISKNMENENFGTLYITSLYFSITTMTTVGYGDIVCHSLVETVFQIILLAIGIIAYSFTISKMENYVRNKNLSLEKMKKDINILEEIRIAYPLMPFDLYQKIYDYLTKRLKKEKKLSFNILITALPYSIKRQILFIVYQRQISNFIFFKNCQNSEFIFRILSRFILVTSKKGEYVIYEKEKLNKIIFVKEGSLSLEALIKSDDPENSIKNYIKNFKGITKILGKEDIEELTYENIAKNPKRKVNTSAIKHKIDELFINQKSIESDYNEDENNDDEEHFYKDFAKMDIHNDLLDDKEIEYHYLKIMEIRKNEHFGDINIFLDEPAPLSLKVKSKISELLLLRKSDAISISNDYPNIWKKLQIKSYFNLFKIKKLTFKKLKRYMETFGLIIINETTKRSSINQLKFTFLNSSLNNNINKKRSLILLSPINKVKKKRYSLIPKMPKSYEPHLIKQDELFSVKSTSIISCKDGNDHIYVSDYSLVNSEKIFNDNDNNTNYKLTSSNLINNNLINNNTDYRKLSESIQLSSHKNFNQNILNFEKESKNKLESCKFLDENKNISKSFINEDKLLEKGNLENDITDKIQSQIIDSSQGNNSKSKRKEVIEYSNEHIQTMSNLPKRFKNHIMKKIKESKRKEKIKLICQFINLFKEDNVVNVNTNSNKNTIFPFKENNDNDKKMLRQKILNQIINIDFREDELLSTSFRSDTQIKYFNEKELTLINENKFEIKSVYPNLIESTKGKISENKKYRIKLFEIVNDYIYNNKYNLSAKKIKKKNDLKICVTKNLENIKTSRINDKKKYHTKSSKKIKAKSSIFLSNKYQNKTKNYENLKSNIKIISEISNKSSNENNNSFLKKYKILNKILDKTKRNNINPSKISYSIDSQNNSNFIKNSCDNSKAEINTNKKNNNSTIPYTIKHNKQRNHNDINNNNDSSNKYNQSGLLDQNNSFIDNENNNKKDFDLKPQTNIIKYKINNNDNDLIKYKMEDKNIKTVFNRWNNLESNNIMRTNIEYELKDFVKKSGECRINLVSKNNKSNCVII